jgi:hypothetical protein
MKLFLFFNLNCFYLSIKLALEEAAKAPLECPCVNCRCFYDEFGTHMRCFPGWNGTLCDISDAALRREFQRKILCKQN